MNLIYAAGVKYTTMLTLRAYKAKPAGPKVRKSQKTNGSSLNDTTGIPVNDHSVKSSPIQGLQAVKESLPTITSSGTTLKARTKEP